MLENQLYTSDAHSYNQIAVNLLDGKGFVTDGGLYARRGPVYPLFLAIIYLIFGYSFVAVRFAQAIIGALTCIIIYLLSKELFDKKVGLIAAFISAIYYPFILQPAYLLTEVLFTFLLIAMLYFLIRYYYKKDFFSLCLGGLIFGISILCKGILFLFIPLLIIWLVVIEFKQHSKNVIATFVTLIFIFLPMFPWIVRNYLFYNAFIPSQIGGGLALYIGNNPKATGGTGGWHKLRQDGFLPENIDNLFTVEVDKLSQIKAINYIRNNPERFIKLGFNKIINMWRPFYVDAMLINKIIMTFSYIPIMIFAILGIFLTRKKYKYISIFYFLFIYYIMIHVIFFGVIRYRYPVMPFFIIFAAFSLVFLINKILKLNKSKV